MPDFVLLAKVLSVSDTVPPLAFALVRGVFTSTKDAAPFARALGCDAVIAPDGPLREPVLPGSPVVVASALVTMLGERQRVEEKGG